MLQGISEELPRALVPTGLAIVIGFVGVYLIVRFYQLAWQAPVHRRLWWVILTGVIFSIVSWSISGLFALGLTRLDIPEVSGFDPVLLTAHLVLAPLAFIPASYFRLFPKSPAHRVAAGAVLGSLLFLSGIIAIISLNIPGQKHVSPWGIALATTWCVFSMALLAGSFDGDSPTARKWFAGIIAFVNLIILLLVMSVTLNFRFDPTINVPSNSIPGDAFIIIVMGFAVIKALSGFLFVAVSRLTGNDMMRDYRTIAAHDYLTGLPNRLYLQDDISKHLSGKVGAGLCLVGFDLDAFKPVNDHYGHATGDTVLQTMADRIRKTLHSDEYCARIGGDEFVAVKRTSSTADGVELAERLSSELMAPIAHGSRDIVLTASFGVVVDRSRSTTLKSLLLRMDLALHHAKIARSGTVRVYEEAMQRDRELRRSLETDLASAIKDNSLELHYQPQYNLKTGSLVAIEALVRWNHSQRGPILPDDFIPVAEESGIIHDLGMWCIDRVCRDRIKFGWVNLPVAVNISPQEFTNPHFADSVIAILRRLGLPGDSLELEMTEFSSALRGEYIRRNMEKLQAIGVTITLDDYGAGHASLGTLRSFPFDKLKVDRSYILSMGSDANSAQIIRSVLLLGRALGIPVVAEGVETEDQESFLKSEQCEIGQGFWFAPPVPGAQLQQFLTDWPHN